MTTATGSGGALKPEADLHTAIPGADSLTDQWDASIVKPPTRRGLLTWEKLLAAARIIFTRDGFLGARITDITAEAGVSAGTFYTYFDSKESIFVVVIKEVNKKMFRAAAVPHDTPRDPIARYEITTRAYIRAYRENTGLLSILTQVATFNPQFRAMRHEIRQIFRNRAEASLRRMQSDGLINRSLSPAIAAEALASMVSGFCHVWLVIGEDYDEEEVIRTLTTLWASGIGLQSISEQ